MLDCVGLIVREKINIYYDKALFTIDLYCVYKRKAKKERMLCVDGLRNFSN